MPISSPADAHQQEHRVERGVDDGGLHLLDDRQGRGWDDRSGGRAGNELRDREPVGGGGSGEDHGADQRGGDSADKAGVRQGLLEMSDIDC